MDRTWHTLREDLGPRIRDTLDNRRGKENSVCMKARLVCYDENGKEALAFPLNQKRTTIGRDAGNFIQLPDRLVSKCHAVIHAKQDGWEIEDLGSRNGILVSGQPVKASVLKSGDIVKIGSFNLIFETAGDDECWPHHRVIDLSTQMGQRTLSR